jgi:hypothetical protein
MHRILFLAVALCLSGQASLAEGREVMNEATVFHSGRKLSGTYGKPAPPEQISAVDLANLIKSSEETRAEKTAASDKSAKKPNPMHPLLAKVKAAKTHDQLRQALLPFTTTLTSLDSLFQKAGTDESGEMDDPIKLKRAESFAVDLDDLPGPEYVSQIVFESKPEFQGNFARAYMVSVHRILGGKPVLAFSTVFDHLYCEMSQRGGMTFAFRDELAHPKRSRVLFNHDLVESCRLVLSGARRTDTLGWDGAGFSYILGPRRDESTADRSNPEA